MIIVEQTTQYKSDRLHILALAEGQIALQAKTYNDVTEVYLDQDQLQEFITTLTTFQTKEIN